MTTNQLLSIIENLLFILCVLWHAFEEKRERPGLATYLEGIADFYVGRWFDWLLFALAIVIPLAPFMLIAFGVIPEDVGKSFVVGALIADAVSTHFYTSLRWGPSPGLKSAILYPFLALFLSRYIGVFSFGAMTLGILAFLGLWPLLGMVKLISQRFKILK